jgi:hypothetical protein
MRDLASLLQEFQFYFSSKQVTERIPGKKRGILAFSYPFNLLMPGYNADRLFIGAYEA